MTNLAPLTIDFSKLKAETNFGSYEFVDCRQAVANTIHGGTSDIGLDDWARAVYYSDKPIPLPPQYVTEFRQIITRSALVVFVKRALLALIDNHIKQHV